MHITTPTIEKVLYAICGVAFSIPCAFFAIYTLRLIYLNLTMDDAAAHRTGGMLIGAIVFPLATIVLGLISWFFIKKALRGFTGK